MQQVVPGRSECWENMLHILELLDMQMEAAARYVWEELPADFRIQTVLFVRDILAASPQEIASCPQIALSSCYGLFQIGPDMLNRLSRGVLCCLRQ